MTGELFKKFKIRSQDLYRQHSRLSQASLKKIRIFKYWVDMLFVGRPYIWVHKK